MYIHTFYISIVPTRIHSNSKEYYSNLRRERKRERETSGFSEFLAEAELSWDSNMRVRKREREKNGSIRN